MNILEYENYQEKKSHTTSAFPYETYLCSIPLDFTQVPLHWHDEMELIYIKKGIGIITVDFVPYQVTAGMIVLILPGQLHSIEQYHNASDSHSMEYENIIFDPGILLSKTADNSNTNLVTPLLNGTHSVPTVYEPSMPYYHAFAACIDANDEINRTKPLGYQLFVKSQLFMALYIITSSEKEYLPVKPQTKSLDKLKSILKFVENHYMDHISIEDIAKEAGLSQSHFMKYFKNTMGTSFIDYLNEYRLTMASRLLLSSESSILNIASEVGYENLSYFNRMFKKRFNITPREYRKKYR